MIVVNYRRYDEGCTVPWSTTWHRGKGTMERTTQWLKARGFLPTADEGIWQGTVFPYDCEARIMDLMQAPDAVRRLFTV